MDNQKEQLLQEIGELAANMERGASLVATISQLEAENEGLQRELEYIPTEQTTWVDEAEKEVREKALVQDHALGQKINKVFLAILAVFTAINVILLFVMLDKGGVAAKMQALNMKFPNYTTEEVVGVIFPWMIGLVLVFHVAAIIVAICIAKIDKGDVQR